MINDQSLGVSREAYAAAGPEKDARAAHASAIKRALGRRVVVIADGLHYIKGFRYQLYCEAKAVRTPSCVVSATRPREGCGAGECLTPLEVHVGTPIPVCRAVNDDLRAGRKSRFLSGTDDAAPVDGAEKGAEESGLAATKAYVEAQSAQETTEASAPSDQASSSTRPSAPADAETGPGDDDGGERGGYAPELFENLIYRYEEPNGMTRWDSPLFTVLPDDADPPYDAIWTALVGDGGNGSGGSAAKTVKPNQATVLVRRPCPRTPTSAASAQ